MARDSRYRKRSRSRSRSSSGSLDRIRGRRSRSRERRRRSRERRSRTPERFRRSRSRERRRSRSRDRDRRRRSRSRGRDRRSWSRERKDRSRSRDRRDRSRDRRGSSRDRSSKKEKEDRRKDEENKNPADVGEIKFEMLDKEAQNKQLELEMQKRRERIEKWRAERKKKEIAEGAPSTANIVVPSVKKWTLEDDDDEDIAPVVEMEKTEVEEKPEKKEVKEEEKEKMEVEEDDVDPLDAFMQGIQEEVKQLHHNNVKNDGEEKAGAKVTMIVGMAKKKDAKSKGELMEQDQDALEYSSEEEAEDLQSAMSNLQANKAKKLLTVTKEDVTYQPFRKNFYVEVPELAKMTMEDVEIWRNEMEGIKVKGKGCPKPIRNWAQCGVSKKVLEILKKHNYEKPTPIQAQAIPAVMSGKDMIGIAKTGSGKTLAFLLPMFRHILDQPSLEADDGPIGIIMTPTRELAMQIAKECKKFAKALSLRVVCVYGGTGISEQIAELKRGAEIIVCTPGRMIDMLAANSGRVTNLKRCTYIVLDEADRMFDMGFEPQVMRIIDSTRPDRQTVMFSATFPRQMEALARRILTKPIEVQVGGRSVVCKDVEQHVVVIEEDGKFLKLLELLGYYQDQGSAIVFVDKQENADLLLKDLIKASYNSMALHGGIDQFDRDSTICDFKAGKVGVLIATSVAARGLDVKHLILVVNYDCPNHYEDYVHRCGRTGRAGNKGYAYTFLTHEQGRLAGDITKALEQSQNPIPEDLQKLWDEYRLKQEAEGKKVKSSSGFSGKGFKFDEAEAQLVNEKKKFQKAALGLQDSDAEDAEADIDKEIETLLAPKKRVQEITILPTGTATLGGPIASAEKLELAKKLASRISLQKNIGAEAQQAAEAVLKGHLGTPVISNEDVFHYTKPEFLFSQNMLDDNFDACLFAPQGLVRNSSFNFSQSSFYNFTRYDYLKFKSRSEQEKWFPLMRVLLDFSTLMLSFLKVEVVLIEPSLLFCMLSPSNKELLVRRKFNVTTYWNSQKSVTFAMRGEHVSDLEKESAIRTIKSFGFETEFINKPIEVWMTDHRTDYSSYFNQYSSHIFFKRGQWTIHLVVLHKRGHFLWHAALAPRIHENIPPVEDLYFVDSNSAYENFSSVSLGMFGEPLITIYIPSNPVHFLFEMKTSKFVECNSTIVNDFFSSLGTKKLETHSSFTETSFNWRTVVALQELKTKLHPLLINFFIWSGTMLGWYRQCNIIPYTGDVDFGAWASEVDDLEWLLKLFTANEHLKLQQRMGLVEKGLEFNLNCHKLRVDVFFLYEENNGTWYAGHRPSKKYYFKYHHPYFTLCSASLLNHKVLVPCDAEAVIRAEYGSQWMQPVTSWNYETSIKNRGPNIYWDENLLSKVYSL